MKKQTVKIFGVLTLSVMLAAGLLIMVQPSTVSADSVEGRGGPGGQGGYGQGMGTGGSTIGATGSNGTDSSIVLTPLSDAEQATLSRAILEEYGALNLYKTIIADIGSVLPFSQILKSEQQHINILVRQAEKYGMVIPENPGLSNDPSFNTLEEACQAGVDAEIADAALYDELETSVTHTDILRVFSNLQNASLNSHLPAFQLCQ